MLLVGLTGGIASGKSVVADLLAERGAVVIDADLLAREAVAPGSSGLAEVVVRFGPGILTAAGELHRAKLGSIVFNDADARADLEAIIHPRVRRRAAELTKAAPAGAVVVQVIPLLVETGQATAFDVVVVVDVDPEVQVARVMRRNHLSRAEALTRLAAQTSRGQRLAAADLVVDNSGTLTELVAAVDTLWTTLVARRDEPARVASLRQSPLAESHK